MGKIITSGIFRDTSAVFQMRQSVHCKCFFLEPKRSLLMLTTSGITKTLLISFLLAFVWVFFFFLQHFHSLEHKALKKKIFEESSSSFLKALKKKPCSNSSS